MLPEKAVHILSLLLTISLHLLLLAFLYQQPMPEISIGESGILIDLQGESEQQAQRKSRPKKHGSPIPEKKPSKTSAPKKVGEVKEKPSDTGILPQQKTESKKNNGEKGIEATNSPGGKSKDTSRLPELLNQFKQSREDFVPYASGRTDGKSPLFTELPEDEEETPEEEIPEEIKKTMRGQQPEKTDNEQIQYTLNTYEWSFTDFAIGWSKSLQKWWRAPADYLAGKIPAGGSVWIRVRIDKKGRLMEYKVYKSKVSPEMELRVVQALISSFDRPPLPDDFPVENLVVNWRFIYPAINANVKLKKEN